MKTFWIIIDTDLNHLDSIVYISTLSELDCKNYMKENNIEHLTIIEKNIEWNPKILKTTSD